jgi:hypothetical protein
LKPRLLTIMGSGETSPTMVKVHRSLLDRLGGSGGPGRVGAVLLDTPFAFQENKAEIAGRAVVYFRESLQTKIEVAGLGDESARGAGQFGEPSGGDPFAEERLTSSVRGAQYVFAGPGSPSYALRRWRSTVVPQLLAEKLEHGGAVTFASAAALTLGVATVPVYEIYKVGEDPHWLPGLDLLSLAGINAAVIPHFDNAEGGTHDTRYCYLGERRLAPMEEELPEGAFVLGIDEHTALVLDLESRSASVIGRGVVTVRACGRSRVIPDGAVVPIEEIVATAHRLASGDASGPVAASPPSGYADGVVRVGLDTEGPGGGELPETGQPLLLVLVREQEELFARAVEARDVKAAVAAILELVSQVVDWSTDIPAGDELDRALASIRSMIVELGRLAETGARDPASVIGPFVDTMLGLRRRARDARRFDESDEIRDDLTKLGIEVRDTPAGTEWVLAKDD